MTAGIVWITARLDAGAATRPNLECARLLSPNHEGSLRKTQISKPKDTASGGRTVTNTTGKKENTKRHIEMTNTRNVSRVQVIDHRRKGQHESKYGRMIIDLPASAEIELSDDKKTLKLSIGDVSE